MLVSAHLWKCRHDAALPEANTWRAYVEANALSYIGGVHATLIAGFWPKVFRDPAPAQRVIWLLVDSVGPMLQLTAGRRLWRKAASESA